MADDLESRIRQKFAGRPAPAPNLEERIRQRHTPGFAGFAARRREELARVGEISPEVAGRLRRIDPILSQLIFGTPLTEEERFRMLEAQPFAEVGLPVTPETVPTREPGAFMTGLEMMGMAAPGVVPATTRLAAAFGRGGAARPVPPTAPAPPPIIPELPRITPPPAPAVPPARLDPFDPAGLLERAVPPMTVPRLTPELTGEVVRAAPIEGLLRTQAAQRGERIFRQVSEALSEGMINVEDLPSILRRRNLSMGEFARVFEQDFSAFGRQLGQLGLLRKSVERALKRNPELAPLYDAMKPKPGEPLLTGWQRTVRLWRSVDDPRRGLMTGQVITAMRNLISQGGRGIVEVFDQSIQRVMGHPEADPFQLMASFAQQLTPTARKEVLKLLDEFPVEQAKLLGTPTGEVVLGTRLARWVNIMNSTQEKFFRLSSFDASLRVQLQAAGIDVMQAMKNPRMIPEEMVEKAFKKSMEMTFAKWPEPGTFGNRFLHMWQDFPFLTTIQPYPRFMANAYKFLLEHNPTGFFHLLKRTPKNKPYWHPERIEDFSKAVTGTAMLAGAMAIRLSPLAGPRWWQINAGTDREGKVRTIDTRAFAPFTQYLFLAEMMIKLTEAGHNAFTTNESFMESLNANGMLTEDVTMGLLSMNRIAGTGLVLVDLMKAGAMDRKIELIRDFMGQYLSGFTVPLRTLKDVVAAFDPEESVFRDPRTESFLEGIARPTMQNIPGLSRLLPEAASSLRADVPRQENPLVRQATGLAVRTLTPVEREVARLAIESPSYDPRTSSPEFNRRIRKIMGPIVERTLTPLVTSRNYVGLPQNVQKAIVMQGLKSARSLALADAKQKFPELYDKVRFELLPEEIEGLIPRDVRERLRSEPERLRLELERLGGR